MKTIKSFIIIVPIILCSLVCEITEAKSSSDITDSLINTSTRKIDPINLRTNEYARYLLSTQSVNYPFNYAVLGDPHNGNNETPICEIFQENLDEIRLNSPNVSFIIICGDFTHGGRLGQYSDYKDYINTWMDTFSIPVFTLVGNHDLEQTAIVNYTTYIDSEFDTKFDYGNSRFIFVQNVQHHRSWGWPYYYEINKNQINKIDQWLLTAPINRFVFSHIPINKTVGSWNSLGANIDCSKSNNQEGYYELHNLFVKHKVTASFAGHVHYSYNFTSEIEEFINYICTAGGGNNPRDTNAPFPNYWDSQNKLFDFHWLEVEVPNQADIKVKMHILGRDRNVNLPGKKYTPAAFDITIPQKHPETNFHTSRGWNKVWSDYQDEDQCVVYKAIIPDKYQGHINSWEVRANDKFYPGDYDGNGIDEILCVENISITGWISLKKYYNNTWNWYWNNSGEYHPITPYKNNLIIGDYDGDDKDEALGILNQQTMFHFDNGKWNSSNANIGGWDFSSTDIYYLGDFNGNGRDELLCVNSAPDGLVSLFSYIINNWELVWSNEGNSSAGAYIYDFRNNLNVGDFNGDGIDEILGVSSYGLRLFKFQDKDWCEIWSQGNSSPLWPYRDDLIVSDFDGDLKDEVLGKYTWMTKFDYNYNNFDWEWSTYGLGYLSDWKFNSTNNYYYPVTNAVNESNHLLSSLKHCTHYLTSMYDYWSDHYNMLEFEILGTNNGANNNWNVQGGDGADQAYLIYVPEACNILITTCNAETNFDTKLELFNQDKSPLYVYNDDYSCTYSNLYSRISTGLNTGYYFVVVDGYGGATGNFKISVTMDNLSNVEINSSKNKTILLDTDDLGKYDSDKELTNINELSNEIKVYPNPAQNNLNIILTGDKQFKIELFNMAGKSIKTIEKVQGHIQMDCSNINSGMYLLKVKSAEKIYQEKIIITK